MALLVLVVSVVFFVSSLRRSQMPPTLVDLGQAQAPTTEMREVRLVRFDAQGLEAPSFVRVELPEDSSARLETILGALREAALDDEWPRELPTPKVFLENLGRRRVAVLDFRPQRRIPLSVEAERRLLRGVEETVLANGVDEIRFLLDGRARGVFLEHLAVPAAL